MGMYTQIFICIYNIYIPVCLYCVHVCIWMCVCLYDKTKTESEKIHGGGGLQGKMELGRRM